VLQPHDADCFLDVSDWIFSAEALTPWRKTMPGYTPKETAKVTAGAVAALVIVAFLAVVALGLLWAS
jgi:hypothetical protein